MKRAICLLAVLLTVLCALPLTVSADAPAYRNYDTVRVTDAQRDEFLSGIGIQFLDQEVRTLAIEDFAVSGEGQIALALTSAERSHGHVVIHVYDSCGVFQYGYGFSNGGSAYAVFFEGELLSVYWLRGNQIGSFDSEGNCVEFQKTQDTAVNHASFHEDAVPPLTGTVGNLKYSAEYPRFWQNRFIRFTVEDGDGSQTVIFEATDEYYYRIVVIAAFVLLFLLTVIASEIKSRKEKRRQDAEDE